jgi:hypothetical protein
MVDPGTNACAAPTSVRQTYIPRTYGIGAGVYSGPALVEESSSEYLMLYFQPSAPAPDASVMADAGVAADAGAPGPLPLHVMISSLKPLPPFPIGARVWLDKDPAEDLAQSFSSTPWQGALWIREHQRGRVLFGVSTHPANDAASPIIANNPSTLCETTGPCPRTRQRLDLHADTTVTLGDNEAGEVSIGGFAYEARLWAQFLLR